MQFIKTDVDFVNDRKYALDKLYNSRSGAGVYYQYKPRNIAKICNDNGITKPQIHISTFQRIAQGVFNYAPRGFPNSFEVVDNNGIYNNPLVGNPIIFPITSDEIVNIVNSGHPTSPPLIDSGKSKCFIWKRRKIHNVFLGYSIFVLYWLIHDDIKNNDILSAIKALAAPDSLLEKLASLFYHNSLLTIGGILIFSISIYQRVEMSKVFTKFWSNLRDSIKPLV